MRKPVAFHVMAKPTGSRCNLSCDYCFFLKKEQLYPGSDFRMSEEMRDRYLRQTIEAHEVKEVTIAWQGGEPTLMGLDFFRGAVETEKRCMKPGMHVVNTLQTNGIRIDEEWASFMKENGFLVGLSMDGPKSLHDIYRHNKSGKGTFKQVLRAARLLQKYEVDYNILCTVNARNSLRPLDVYRFFRDELKANYLQFIPIVERDNSTGNQQGKRVTDRSVRPEQWGNFLISIFDEWVRNDVGNMFVLFFDAVLASYIRGYSNICTLQPICGDGVALEHNGDLYSCDHYVEPDYLLGNIANTPINELVASKRQRAFGHAKSDALPEYCRKCEFLFTCHGECPKNRLLSTPDGEPGLNWLCTGLKNFFSHSQWHMEVMSQLFRSGLPVSRIMEAVAKAEKLDEQVTG